MGKIQTKMDEPDQLTSFKKLFMKRNRMWIVWSMRYPEWNAKLFQNKFMFCSKVKFGWSIIIRKVCIVWMNYVANNQ